MTNSSVVTGDCVFQLRSGISTEPLSSRAELCILANESGCILCGTEDVASFVPFGVYYYASVKLLITYYIEAPHIIVRTFIQKANT